MASITSSPTGVSVYRLPAISWGSIFAGAFVFLAIEVTFGLLGLAIFTSAATQGSAPAIGGMSVGAGIWTIVLSMIALYFGGKTAARVSGATTSSLGLYHGLVTYGMSILATILIAAMTVGSTIPGNGTLSRLGNNTISGTLSTSAWWIFFACLLGMISASVGGTHGAREPRAPVANIDRDRNLRAA